MAVSETHRLRAFLLASFSRPTYNANRFMVHHIVLFKLKPDMSDEQIEELMMNTRRLLLRIPEARNVKCGKRIDPQMHWEFFLAADFESTEKLQIYREDPIHFKYVEEFLRPSIVDKVVLDYEMDPRRDIRYS